MTVLPIPYRKSARPGWSSPRLSTASRVLESSDEESAAGGSVPRTVSTAATSPAPMTLIVPPQLIGAVWAEARARLLRVAKMTEHLESAVTQLTEVSSMLLARVETTAESGLEEGGSRTRRTSGEVSPVAQVSHEDLVRVREPTAEEVDRWFVDEAVRDVEWAEEQEQSSSSNGME